TPQAFRGSYWGARPLHIRGARDKFLGLLAREDVGRLALESARREFPPNSLEPRLMASHPDRDHTPSRVVACAIRPRQGGPMLAPGWRVSLGGLHLLAQPPAFWREGLMRGLSLPLDHGNLTFFLSPLGEGLPGHAAPEHLLVLQIHGIKSWRFAAEPRHDI